MIVVLSFDRPEQLVEHFQQRSDELYFLYQKWRKLKTDPGSLDMVRQSHNLNVRLLSILDATNRRTIL